MSNISHFSLVYSFTICWVYVNNVTFFVGRFFYCADVLIPIWILKIVIATNCWGYQFCYSFCNQFRDWCRHCLAGSERNIRISLRLTAVALLLRCPTRDFVITQMGNLCKNYGVSPFVCRSADWWLTGIGVCPEPVLCIAISRIRTK